MKMKIFISLFLLALLMSCESGAIKNPPADNLIKSVPLQDNEIDEASGIEAGIRNKGILWIHNDSGDKPRIFAVDTAGKTLAEYHLEGIEKLWKDCEDIAAIVIDGKEFIFLADIGDNRAKRKSIFIYIFPEPEFAKNKKKIKGVIKDIEILELQYPDGSRDAEAFFVDPLTYDFFIISKRDKKARLYKTPYPRCNGKKRTLNFLAELNLGSDENHEKQIVAADISSDGKKIILKSYEKIFYFKRKDDESVKNALLGFPLEIPYMIEPQGESICWSPDEKGYCTLSEKRDIMSMPPIYFYEFTGIK